MPVLNQPEPIITPPKKHRLSLIGILGLAIVLIGSFIFIYQYWLGSFDFLLKRSNSAQGSLSQAIIGQDQNDLSQMPFYEMTIPALREKTYESELGPLEEIGQNANYTSYLTYFTSEGLKINGLLTVPVGQEPEGGWPAIVFIHGYIPPTVYETQGQYADYVDYLARNGFVVFKIDLRGHAQSEGEPGGGYYGSDYVTDALSSYTALAKSGFVNSDKIGLWGHSMAGNIVMRSMAAKPDIPAGVIWAGAVYTYVDMQKYGIDDNSYRPPTNNTIRQKRRRELFEKHGTPSAQSEFWLSVAPTSFLSDITGAVQLHHATDDDVVNIGYSRDLSALLDQANVTHELNEYSTGGHNISGSSFTQAMQNTVEFFREHL